MNLDEINANLLRQGQNNDNAFSFMEGFFGNGASSVQWSSVGADGTQNVRTYPTLQKLTGDVSAAVKGEMIKTICVDEVNGDDNNDGTSSAPIQNIHNAINAIPDGGTVNIILLSDCHFSANAYGNNKTIVIHFNGYTLDLVKYDFNGLKILYAIIGYGNILYLYGQSNANSKLRIPALLAGESIFSVGHSVFLKSVGSISPEFNKLHIGYGLEVLDNGAFYLCTGVGSACSYTVSTSIYTSESGTARNFEQLVSGVMKDINGVPRNVQSNLIL